MSNALVTLSPSPGTPWSIVLPLLGGRPGSQRAGLVTGPCPIHKGAPLWITGTEGAPVFKCPQGCTEEAIYAWLKVERPAPSASLASEPSSAVALEQVPGLALSIGQGRQGTRSRSVPVAAAGTSLAASLAALPALHESWLSLHTWREGRCGEDWISASGTVVDLDHYIADAATSRGRRKAPPPDALRAAILGVIDRGQLPGTVFHHTTNGERIYFLFTAPVTDSALYQRAYYGAVAQVAGALMSACVPLADADGLNGYKIDPSVEDLGQFFWSPRATVNGTKRNAAPIILREPPFSAAELADQAPAEEAPTSAAAAISKPGATSFSTLNQARDEFNRQNTPAGGWGKPGLGSCPACGHNDCFGLLKKVPSKWACFSDNHVVDVGQRGDGCWWGDALDMAAHAAGRSPTEHLRKEGYLTPRDRVQRTEDAPVPAPKSRVVGEDNGDEPRIASLTGWPDLIPFDRPMVPAFPTEVLPDWQRLLVEAAAVETETAPDLGALAVLSAQATACARKFQVEQRPGFLQPVALWTLSLLKSGGRKSRVFSLSTDPLSAWQKQRGDELREQIATEQSRKRRLQEQLKRAERAAATAKSQDLRKVAEVEADDLAHRLATCEVTREPILFITEGTPERIEELLCEQGERLAVLSDENGMLDLLGGRYSKGSPNLSNLNKAHDGGAIRVARKKRDDGSGGDRMLEHALVTFGLSVQPDLVFAQLRTQSAFFASGFAWRFLFALVPSSLGYRTQRTATTPAAVIDGYCDRMRELLQLPTPALADLPTVRMTLDATEALRAWEVSIEPLYREGRELGHLESWASKLASRLCRIAALFHAAEQRSAPWDVPISLETMHRALRLAPYFIAHVQAVAFELNADQSVRLARKALEWVQRERRTTFSKRELQKVLANNGEAEVLTRPLSILRARGFIRGPVKKLTGGRASELYYVNPAALETAS